MVYFKSNQTINKSLCIVVVGHSILPPTLYGRIQAWVNCNEIVMQQKKPPSYGKLLLNQSIHEAPYNRRSSFERHLL